MKLIRITTALISLDKLLEGQMRRAAEHGLEVLMVSADGPRRELLVEREGCPHVIVPMRRGIAPLADVPCLWQLYRLFRRERPQIVHSHTPKAGLLAMLAARLAGVPFRIHTWGGLRLQNTTGLLRRLLLSMERLTARCATYHLVNSRALAQRLEALAIATPKILGNGSTNGVDLERFRPDLLDTRRQREFRRKIGLEEGDRTLLFLGRLVRDKGIEELVHAFVELSSDYPEALLLLVGDSEPELDPIDPSTLEQIREHPRIRQLPWSEEVPELLSIAELVAHPSHREGFSNVILQAGACQCPLVCSEIPENLEAIGQAGSNEPAVCAFTFPPGDTEALARALRAALNEPDTGKRARALRQHVTKHYDRARVQDLTLAFYGHLPEDHLE